MIDTIESLRAELARLRDDRDALHAELDGTRAELAQEREERDKARLYCAEVASYICDPMYDKVENRAGIAADAEAMATGEMTGRYLDIKTQTDRAIKAEAERDAAVARAEALHVVLCDLLAVVRGECPALLDEDRGGDANLAMRIDAALAQEPQR